VKSPETCRQGGGDGKNRGGKSVGFIEARFIKAQNGDARARNDLCSYVWKVTHRRALTLVLPSVYDAEDFAQDVVIEFLEQLPQIRNLKHWLLRVLVGAQATAYRRHHQKHVISCKVLPDRDGGAFEDRQLAYLETAQLLEVLAPVERDLLYLRYVDCCSFAEIARLLDSTEGAVKTQFWRTKTYLQKLLGPHSGEVHPHESHSQRT
jgi:RNA polymerase sigma factor (sigma-70 family)